MPYQPSRSATPRITNSVETPDGTLYYELRGEGPVIVLVGSPMHAEPFAPLADLLSHEHSVLTLDPRGIRHSTVKDRSIDSTPELRANDLARLIEHVDRGRAAVFGSSGGAVTALALAQSHPDLLRAVVAHEPPLNELLDDRDDLRRTTQQMCERYLAGDIIGAWRMFFATANIPVPPEAVEHMFGGERDPQDVADEHYWFARELRPSTWWHPDVAVLQERTVTMRIEVGIGEDSTGQECDRTSRALCRLLGRHPVLFPGDHTGFVTHPEAFSTRLASLVGEH
ncbi:alpha/beta fold hydrolase [Microbacterium sp. YY-01]|uniref:alpha/beta fold hydrolase n=1 Tax=Microbacterium sp. YY-01 TaxID=3421634 RepID=UPI003D17DEF5